MTYTSDPNSPQLNPYEKLEYAGKYHDLLEYSQSISGVEAKYWEIYALIRLENYDEALKKSTVHKSLFVDDKWNGKYNNLRGWIYNNKQNFVTALVFHEISLEIFTTLENKQGIAQSNYHLARACQASSENAESDKAMAYFVKSLEILSELDDKLGIATSLWTQGNLFWRNGELDKAQDNYKKSLEISQEIGHKLTIGESTHGLGLVYGLKSNPEIALKYFQESYKIFIEIGKKDRLTAALDNISVIYSGRGEYDKAIATMEEGLKIHQSINHSRKIAGAYRNLVAFSIYNKNRENAKKYLDELENLVNQKNDKWITARFMISKAHYLKSSKRLNDKMQSQKIFERLISDEWRGTVDIQIYKYAIINLMELLFIEYQTSQDKEVLVEIHKYLKILEAYSRKKLSYSAIAYSLLIKSQLELIEGNFDVAQTILEQALIMVEEKNFGTLGKIVTEQKEKMRKEIAQMKELLENNANFTERMEKSNLMSYIKQAQGMLMPNDK